MSLRYLNRKPVVGDIVVLRNSKPTIVGVVESIENAAGWGAERLRHQVRWKATKQVAPYVAHNLIVVDQSRDKPKENASA